MALSDPIRDFKRSDLTRPDYTGVVVDNNDPEKRQRVRIRVPQLHRNTPDEWLPWSAPKNNGNIANAGAGVGSVFVPPKGAKLDYSLTDNDPHNPQYGGSVTTDDVNKDNPILQEDYPHTYGAQDQAGNLEKTNTDKNTKTFIHKSGATTHIDGNGAMSHFSPNDISLVANGKITIVAGGGIVIQAGGNLDMKGARIDFNGNSAPQTIAPTAPRTRPSIPSPAGQDKL